MNTAFLRSEIPTSVIAAVLGIAIVTLAYSVLVTRSVVVWLAVWMGILGIGVGVFVIYLFYRLVVAVETIAEDT